MKAAKDCMSMEDLRTQIDAFDRELVAQLRARARYIDRAAELKPALGWPARIDDRVEAVVENVREAAHEQGLDPDLVEQLWRIIIDWSIAREEKVLGPSER